MKRFLLSSFFFALFFFSSPLFFNNVKAQDATSNCAITHIGNGDDTTQLPSNCQSGGSTTSTTGNAFVDAAQSLKNAWVTCNQTGSTLENATDVACISNHVSQYHPTSIFTDAFNYPDYVFNGIDYGNCVQCLGFVRLVAILVTGQDSTGTFLLNSDPASIINDSGQVVYANGGTFIQETSPQPGDIGMTNAGGFGHILIVKQLKQNQFNPNLDSFVAIESNWVPCTVTDDQSHLDSGFVFYRYVK